MIDLAQSMLLKKIRNKAYTRKKRVNKDRKAANLAHLKQ